jgi:hypothetical protein
LTISRHPLANSTGIVPSGYSTSSTGMHISNTHSPIFDGKESSHEAII